MRENKFRAWDEQYKCFFFFTLKDLWAKGCETQLDELNDSKQLSLNTDYPYENEEQYTGLKDKNGKEIYEGDIVEWQGHEVINGKQIRPLRVWEVQYNYPRLFQIENIIRDNGTLRIIGNIYENPELVKG